MNKNFKINQKTMLVVALLALVVFYMWSRSISKYAEVDSSSYDSSSGSYDSSSGSYDSMMYGAPSSGSYDSMMYAAPSSYEPPFLSAAPSSMSAPSPSSYSGDDGLMGMRADDQDAGYATLDGDFGTASMGQEPNCALGSGIGLASSLLPREVAKVENFGDFAPDDILRGQNFLDTRNQIGFPETLGGNIRNGNQQIRADPPNPKQPFIWNNSTIVPDLMQRDLCT
jgi:hypothetical protein